jgi:hypothetical protein
MAVTSSGTARVTLPSDEQILITREFGSPDGRRLTPQSGSARARGPRRRVGYGALDGIVPPDPGRQSSWHIGFEWIEGGALIVMRQCRQRGSPPAASGSTTST